MWIVESIPDARKPDGTAYTSTDLREIQDWIIRPQLRMVEGVTEVNTIGGFVKQYHVTPTGKTRRLRIDAAGNRGGARA